LLGGIEPGGYALLTSKLNWVTAKLLRGAGGFREITRSGQTYGVGGP
jgi:hypothetical protein